MDNYNRCLEKSENEKGPKMISYIFLRILILIFCVLFFCNTACNENHFPGQAIQVSDIPGTVGGCSLDRR